MVNHVSGVIAIGTIIQGLISKQKIKFEGSLELRNGYTEHFVNQQ